MNTDIFYEPFFQRALLACLLAGIACGVIGTLIVVRRISSISGSLAHAALGGVGLASFAGVNPVIGAALFAVVTALLVCYLHFRSRGDLETLITMVWSVGMAVGVLFLALTPGYSAPLESYLFGSLILVPQYYLIMSAIVDLFLVGLVVLHFHSFRAVCFDEEYATVSGLPAKRIFALLLVLVALSIVVLMRVVGVVLMIALFTVPAIIGRQWFANLAHIMFSAVAIAIFCCLGGLILSYEISVVFDLSLPTGPLIVILSAICFATSSLLARRI